MVVAELAARLMGDDALKTSRRDRPAIQRAADAFMYVRGISGALCVLAPGPMSRGWTAEASRLPGGQLAVRSLGSREVALAWGLSRAGDDPHRRRSWLIAAAVADAVDVAGTAWSLRRLKGGWGSVATITLGSIACATQLAAARQRPVSLSPAPRSAVAGRHVPAEVSA